MGKKMIEMKPTKTEPLGGQKGWVKDEKRLYKMYIYIDKF